MSDEDRGGLPPTELLIASAAVSNGTTREKSPFIFTLKGNLIYEVDGVESKVMIKLEFDKSTDGAEPQIYLTTQPLDYFPTLNDLISFLQDVKGNFFELMRQNLTMT